MSRIADKVFSNKNIDIIQKIATSSNYPVCMVRSIIRRTLHNCNKSMLITENETKICVSIPYYPQISDQLKELSVGRVSVALKPTNIINSLFNQKDKLELKMRTGVV